MHFIFWAIILIHLYYHFYDLLFTILSMLSTEKMHSECSYWKRNFWISMIHVVSQYRCCSSNHQIFI